MDDRPACNLFGSHSLEHDLISPPRRCAACLWIEKLMREKNVPSRAGSLFELFEGSNMGRSLEMFINSEVRKLYFCAHCGEHFQPIKGFGERPDGSLVCGYCKDAEVKP